MVDRRDLDERRRESVQLLERFLAVLCGFQREKCGSRYEIRFDFPLGHLSVERSENRNYVGGVRTIRPAPDLLLDGCFGVSNCHVSRAVVVEATEAAVLPRPPPRWRPPGVFLALDRLRLLGLESPCSAASPSVLGGM